MSHTNIKISNVEIYARLFYNNIKDHCCFCFVFVHFFRFFHQSADKAWPGKNSKGPPDCELELTRQGNRDALRCVHCTKHCILPAVIVQNLEKKCRYIHIWFNIFFVRGRTFNDLTYFWRFSTPPSPLLPILLKAYGVTPPFSRST